LVIFFGVSFGFILETIQQKMLSVHSNHSFSFFKKRLVQDRESFVLLLQFVTRFVNKYMKKIWFISIIYLCAFSSILIWNYLIIRLIYQQYGDFWLSLYAEAITTLSSVSHIILITLLILLTYYLKQLHLRRLFIALTLILVLGLNYLYSNQHEILSSFPAISKITPMSGTTWYEISLYGTNFGDAQYNEAGVFYNSTPARVLLWSNTRVVFEVGANVSESGYIHLRNVDYKHSNKVWFNFEKL
jgi:hypothetical protein